MHIQPRLRHPPAIPLLPSSTPKHQLPSPFHSPLTASELANDIEEAPEGDNSPVRTSGGVVASVEVVRALYKALRSRDVDIIHKLLAPDLEWWFHGPPSHQYLMRLLTGSSNERESSSFAFVPETISSFGPIVLAEGCDRSRSIFWVHAWSVADDGVITQVKEYFNTSVTVTRFGGPEPSDLGDSEIAPATAVAAYCTSVWESSLSGQVGKSVPGLVLAL